MTQVADTASKPVTVGRPPTAVVRPLVPPAVRESLLLHKIHRSWGPVPVLRGVTVELESGTATWIGGRNGVGKTTLLRIAAGLIRPDSGTILLDELSPRPHRREYHRRIGYLPAGDRGMHGRLTVRQHLEFCARIAMMAPADREPAIQRMLDAFDLRELERRRLDRMSMGQRQRVRLAQTCLHDPDVLLLDEPRNSLDGEGMALLTDAVRDLCARGGAALWCSPLGEPLADVFDALWTIEDGELKPL